MFGLGLGQLVVGLLSDTLGRRSPLLAGLAGYTVFSVACVLAPSATALVAFRLLQALSGSAGLVIARAVVRDLYSGRAGPVLLGVTVAGAQKTTLSDVGAGHSGVNIVGNPVGRH